MSQKVEWLCWVPSLPLTQCKPSSPGPGVRLFLASLQRGVRPVAASEHRCHWERVPAWERHGFLLPLPGCPPVTLPCPPVPVHGWCSGPFLPGGRWEITARNQAVLSPDKPPTPHLSHTNCSCCPEGVIRLSLLKPAKSHNRCSPPGSLSLPQPLHQDSPALGPRSHRCA